MKTRLWKVVMFLLLGWMLSAEAGIAHEIYIPHIAGSKWNTVLLVDNNGLSNSTYGLTLYNASGRQVYHSGNMTAALSSQQAIDIKSLSGTAVTGIIDCDSEDVSFRLAYEHIAGGGLSEFLLPEKSYPYLGFYFSDFSQNVTWKGLALGNVNASDATVNLYAYGDGSLLEINRITLGPYERVAGPHTTWFPSVPFSRIDKIIAVSTSNLCGLSMSGNASSSLLLFTPGVGPIIRTAAETNSVLLADYYPLSTGYEWNYDGTDGNGDPAQTTIRVGNHVAVDVNGAVIGNAYREYRHYSNNGNIYNIWYEYMDCTAEEGFIYYGDDADDEDIRLSPPVSLPAEMQIGVPYSSNGDLYDSGALEGSMTFTGTILGRSPVDTPAGYFEDCIVILFAFEFPDGNPQISMAWWAKGVGMVLNKGIAGGGAKKLQELVSYDVTP